MDHNWDANLLLTQYFDTPIRFYSHEDSIDLTDIKTHVHSRIHGIDSKGKHHLLHNENILFAIPVEKIKNVRDRIEMLPAVRNLKLNRKSATQNHFCVDDVKLESVVGDNVTIVTRRGHILRGELQAFDKSHLFMRIGKEMVLVYRNGLFGFKEELDKSLAENQNLHRLRKKREKWVEANRENDFEEGIKHLLTDLYPDDAHFIYELLQNAEDAGASEVKFVLHKDYVTVEHNGDRLFSINDVEAITSIGFSTKKDDPTAIGKFGIGFKAVFAYTSTPEIESGEFHFRIRDIVVPDTGKLSLGALGAGKTRFTFPFDNPKKSPEKAKAEIEKNLRELNENTLLFLRNIRRIEYQLPDAMIGSLERKDLVNDENRIEIYVTRPTDQVSELNQYLRFTKEVDVQDEDGQLKRCRIAVAFGMDKSKDESWKIKPLNPGQVSIYFPAVKETSNLRFHLHAPFASTVARDSVRDCPANDELRDHLARLVAESMHTIREQGLLNIKFLATLPNFRDILSSFYLPIQGQLVTEFNNQELVPMKNGGHAAASSCYRGPRALSDLINDEDLATLLEKDRDQPLWIANPPQIHQPEDNFLSKLDISLWEPEELIKIIDSQSDRTMEFLRKKPVEWHQDLYGFLGDIALEPKYKLSNLRIILCSDGEYRTGSECHFLDDMEFEVGKEKAQSEEFHYVAKGVYSSGQNKNRQQKSREFLEKIGVCEVDEAERVKAILRQRYEDPYTEIPPKLHQEDMKRFIALVEKEPDRKDLFKKYRIFKTADHGSFDGGFYHKASIVFLDLPYLETGLKVYCEDDEYWEYVCTKNIDPYLSLDYGEADIDPEKLGEFAKVLGARTQLEAKRQMIPEDHPEFNYLHSAHGYKRTHKGINEDYSIPEFLILLTNPSVIKSKLVWATMDSAPDNSLKSQFRWNQSYPKRETDSTLVHELRNAKWIPQENGDSISFVRPCDAVKDNLPGGFPYDTGQKWLEAIEFGKTAAKQQRLENTFKDAQNRRNQRAKELGFESQDEAEKAVEIFKLLKKQGKSPDVLLKESRTRERRMEQLIIDLSDAEEKNYEVLARSIRSTRNTIDPSTTLRALYTRDEDMYCQMCSNSMPFKKRNGDEDYFEAVEALGKHYFFKEHEAQYLALCPECTAEYKEYVKRDPKAQKVFHDALKNSDSPQIQVESNGRTIHIRFEDKHWQDLKTVLY